MRAQARHDVDRSADVDGHRAQQLLARDGIDRANWREAGVIHDGVGNPEHFNQPRDPLRDLPRVGDIARNSESASRASDQLSRRPGGLQVEVKDPDTSSQAAQDQGGGPADSTAGAGDEHGLVLEIDHGWHFTSGIAAAACRPTRRSRAGRGAKKAASNAPRVASAAFPAWAASPMTVTRF